MCASCFGEGEKECVVCLNPNQISYKGECIAKAPTYWNIISVYNSTIQLFYGVSEKQTYIYFRLIAANSR